MRIIAGEFRRRLLETPRDAETTRPIPDRVKESLFSLLRGHCEGASVFDGFSGTGAIGLEAVSRGAARCVCVERDRGVAAILKRNIETLGVQDRCELVVGDALGVGALARAAHPLTLAFLDPPYAIVREPLGFRRVMEQMRRLVESLTPEGFAILRTPWPLHIETPLPSAAPKARASHRKGKKTRRHDWRDEGESGVENQESEAIEDAAPKGGVERTPADLSIPGARGPETHVYHTMAVHLYMRG